jgi:hypothetical protein
MTSGTKDEEKPDSRSSRLERVLWHPLRSRIFEELQKEPIDPPALALVLDIPLAIATYHYRVLKTAGGLPDFNKPEHG